MENKNSILNFLFNLDRRVIYFALIITISIPFFLKPTIKIRITDEVRNVYAQIETAAKNNKPIIIGFDYDPATLAELQPMAEALLRHAFSRNVKVLGITFMPNAVSLAVNTLATIAKEFGKVEGEDYVFLPYLPQYSILLLNFGINFRKSYKKDFRGIDVDEIPMLKDLQNFDDFQIVIDISGTKMPLAYIIYGVNKYKFNFATGVTAVSATEYFPFLDSGQMKGLIIGMKGAAEYESLAKYSGDAMRGMASQTWGHLIIIFFIILGNIIFFIRKRQ